MKFFQILKENSDEAQDRRENREWELGPDCPEEGLKAHALLEWLRDNGDADVRTADQTDRLNFLKSKLEELQNSEDEVPEEQIEEIEDEISELEDAIDVYDIYPSGSHYRMDEFEVPSIGGGRRYAVGTSDEVRKSAEDAIDSLVDELGVDAFSKSFASSHLDADKIAEEARDYYDRDVYENPDSYLNDNQRDLSDKQSQEVSVLKRKITQAQNTIEYLNTIEGTEDKIEELQNLIDDSEYEMEEIEGSPDGEYFEDAIQEKVDEFVDYAERNPEQFLSDFGLNWKDFVDMEALKEDAIDTDGEAHFINNYDGSSDEIQVQDQTFVVMRID